MGEIDAYVSRSLMLVTALSPAIGYDKASAIGHPARDTRLWRSMGGVVLRQTLRFPSPTCRVTLLTRRWCSSG